MKKEKDIIEELAKKGLEIIKPSGYKPYRVERLFRESTKAVTDLGRTRISKQDYVNEISGRLQKTIRRMMDSDEYYFPEGFKMENLDEKTDEFAKFYVEEILMNLCDGNPGRLKKLSNNLADGFYAATLRRK